MDELYARFNFNPTKLNAWSRLLMISINNLPPPDVMYSRAITTLLLYKSDLIRGNPTWHEVPKDLLPPGILFSVEAAPPTSPVASLNETPGSSGPGTPYFQEKLEDNDGNERVIFALPSELSAFLEYQTDIQEILHDPRLFKPTLDDQGNPILTTSDELDPLLAPALRDIFYLLQLVVPGMFLLVHDSLSFSRKPFSLNIPTPFDRRYHQRSNPSQGGADSTASRESTKISLRRTRRALPPAEWIEDRMDRLESIFGKQLLHTLLVCARDVELTIWVTHHGPDGDQLDAGSDAGFDSPRPLDMSWTPEAPFEQTIDSIDIPPKVSALTPDIGTRNHFVNRTRLARSL